MSEQRRADWLEIREAMQRVVTALGPLDSETIPLRQALNRVLAERILSPVYQPPWDNSAMDGYAVHTADVRTASAEQPARLHVLEQVPAGAFATQPVEPGTAIRIMTGAPLPKGADCVIRVEHTELDGEDVLVVNAQDAGRNVRFRGEDLRAGDLVLEAGRLLGPGEIGLLATVGKAHVPVHRAPTVAILSTGDELAELDQFDEVLAGRKIANSNSYALAAGVQATGAIPLVLGIARDDEASLSEHIERALSADMLITTAGASVGDHDLVKDVLDARRFRLEFWRVRMRPGSPFSFGFLPAGKRQLPVFGLPGNPVSALVTFELFVRPALRRLQGRDVLYPVTRRVRVAEHTGSKSGLAHFLRVRLTETPEGIVEARLTGAQGSGLITSMAEADGLLVVPEERDGFDAGDEAWAVQLAPGDDAQEHVGF